MNNDNTQYITITMINTTQNNNEQWLQWTMTIHQKKKINNEHWTMYNNSNEQYIVHNEKCTTITMHNIY